jgi:hypothetical protein
MQISTNSLLSTLSESNSKEVLKNEIAKAVQKESNVPLHVQIKNRSIGDLMDSLFKEVASNPKAKEAIASTLKNSDIQKNIQNTSDQLSDLSKQFSGEKVFEKYLPKIEKFLVDIKQIDAQTLKEQIRNAGPFMESKLKMDATIGEMPSQKIQKVLEKLQEVLKQTQAEAQKAEVFIKDFKTLLSSIQQNKNVENGLHVEIKKLLQNIQSMDFKIDKDLLKSLQKYETLFSDMKKPELQQQIVQIKNSLIGQTNQSIYNAKIEKVIVDIQQTIQSIQGSINSSHQDFASSLRDIAAKIKSMIQGESTFAKSIIKLENLLPEIKLNESRVQNSSSLAHNEIEKLNTDVKSALMDIKTSFLSQSFINIPLKSADAITKLIDLLLNQNNFFTKDTPAFETTKQLTSLLETLKTTLKNVDIKQANRLDLFQAVSELDRVIKNEFAQTHTRMTQKSENPLLLKEQLSLDVKATLLKLKEDILALNTPKAKEMLLQVDKTLAHIEYYQLNSHVTNGTMLYLPFLWQGLEKGEISFKKLKENRFFCEINLSLKEYGKIDLMLMLYENNHIDISVFAQKEQFIDVFRENLQDLKIGLNKLSLIPSNIHFFDSLKDEKIKKQAQEFISATQIDIGINIQV